MSKYLLFFPVVFLFIFHLAPIQAQLPEEGVSEYTVYRESPYRFSSRVLTSDNLKTKLEITVDGDGSASDPSFHQQVVGLVAVAPTGRITTSIGNASADRIGQSDDMIPVDIKDIPDDVIKITTPVIWRDLRVVTLSVAPCWKSGETVFVNRRIEVEIINEGGIGENEKTRPVGEISSLWDRMYRRNVLNYEDLDLPRMTRGTGNRFIIVSRTLFDSAVTDFVEWKTRQGFGVDLVTLEDLGYSSPTQSGAIDAIKDYILDAYNTWPETPEFVLLVGDMNSGHYNGSIWTETFYNYFYSQGNRPYDQYYGLLEGSDLFADIMVGRIPDYDADRVEFQLYKTLTYEKEPHIDGTWQRNAIMTLDSSISETINTKNSVSDNLSSWGMNVSEFFSSPWNVLPAINQGVTFYNYRGDYCSSNGWGSTFDIYDVSYVGNTNKPGVWTIISCSSGAFDYSDPIAAEAMLRKGYDTSTIQGAVAFIGSQAYTAYQYNNPLDKGFYYAWTDSGTSILGEAFISAKIYAWNHMPGGFDPNRRDCMMREYTILGDPSLRVWTEVPEEMNVSASPAALPLGQTTNVTISVNDLTRGAVSEALVCLRRDPDVYVYGYTNASGEVSLSVTPTSIGNIDLTVTASNQVPILDDVEVVPASGPYVVYGGNAILGNGMADIGESVSMNIQLDNIGSATAYAVQGEISSAQPGITITTSTRNYGNIGAGNSALPPSPFQYDVGTLPDGTTAVFDLDITSGDSLWESSFNVLIHAPVLENDGMTVLDPLGNGDGYPDPGETVQLFVEVRNNGSGTAFDTQLTLQDSDPYITISGSNTKDLGDIPTYNTEMSPGFTLVLSPSCPAAYEASVPFNLESNNGAYSESGTLYLIIGRYDLLYVDADNEDTETRITDALDAIGVTYSRWNTSDIAVVPVDTLLKYRTVLWAAGDQNTSSITTGNQSNLGEYLDNAGSLLFSGENYLSAYPSESFTSEYLHVADYEINISGSGVNGTENDPVGDDVSLALSYPSELSDTPDEINPDGFSATSFTLQGSGESIVIRYPASDPSVYRVLFFGVALESFPESGTDPNNIQAVINRSLTWLGGGDRIAPTTPTDPALSSDGTLTWSASTDNVGVDQYLIYRSDQSYFGIEALTPVTTTSGTGVLLTEGIGDQSINYTYRITAMDVAGNESDPSMPVGEFDFLTD